MYKKNSSLKGNRTCVAAVKALTPNHSTIEPSSGVETELIIRDSDLVVCSEWLIASFAVRLLSGS